MQRSPNPPSTTDWHCATYLGVGPGLWVVLDTAPRIEFRAWVPNTLVDRQCSMEGSTGGVGVQEHDIGELRAHGACPCVLGKPCSPETTASSPRSSTLVQDPAHRVQREAIAFAGVAAQMLMASMPRMRNPGRLLFGARVLHCY